MKGKRKLLPNNFDGFFSTICKNGRRIAKANMKFSFLFLGQSLKYLNHFSEEDEFCKKVILITFWKVEQSHGGCQRTFNEDTVIALVTFSSCTPMGHFQPIVVRSRSLCTWGQRWTMNSTWLSKFQIAEITLLVVLSIVLTSKTSVTLGKTTQFFNHERRRRKKWRRSRKYWATWS